MKRVLLKMIVILSILSFLLFLTGFILGTNDVLSPKGATIKKLHIKEPAVQNKEDGRLIIVGLGDSLTRGVGDREGIGYIGRVENSLKALHQNLTLTNLAVSGAKTIDLLSLLQKNGIQYSLASADSILLTIGGNDLNPGWDRLGEIDLTAYQGDVATFRKNGKAILDAIRSINKESPIYWIGLYNPFEDIPELKGSAENVLNWNAALESFTADYPNVFVIPVYDLFQGQTKKLLYTDHFHPNGEGYRSIAERLLQKMILQLGIDTKKESE